MDTYGYIYENTFTVLDLEVGLVAQNNDKGCNEQFQITIHRQMNTSFILVVTTHLPDEQGNFSIIISGPNNVNVTSISMCICFFELNSRQINLVYMNFCLRAL